MNQTAEWQPGDPVYPEQGLQISGHCGPCLVAWTADTDQCPECGQPSTQALQAAIARVRARHPRETVDHPLANGGPQHFCRRCERPWPCPEIAALDGIELLPATGDPARYGWRSRRKA